MDPLLSRFFVVAIIVALAVGVGRWWRARSTRVERATSGRLTAHDLAAVGLTLDDVRSGALLLGSATCAPCEQVKQVLGTLAQKRRDFTWAYADAADHPHLTAALRILRVPTVLVISTDGRIVARSSGVPRPDALEAALDAA